MLAGYNIVVPLLSSLDKMLKLAPLEKHALLFVFKCS